MRLRLLYNTVKHLRREQLIHQLLNRFRSRRKFATYVQRIDRETKFFPLTFTVNPQFPVYATEDASFNFLNLEKRFGTKIDWGFLDYGKLWNYNLHYAYYVHQEDIGIETRVKWITSLYKSMVDGSVPNEPYPASLRIMNLVRFLSRHHEHANNLSGYLKADIDFLSDNLEFHLLGNHLLENAFAMMMGAAFFENKYLFDKGTELLSRELKEQVLKDGGHFELSPMYHQVIFFRILELADWYSSYPNKNAALETFIRSKAGAMLGWLKEMTFSSGSIPHFNDSTDGIAFNSTELFKFAQRLQINPEVIKLKESGFFRFDRSGYECIIDAGDIGASYQAGHGHSDALSFVLYVGSCPLIVDTGTSTYEAGTRRSWERSTYAHNTVVINNENQSEVWGAFRVGNRAKVRVLKHGYDYLIASHDGYKRIGASHIRSFNFKESEVIIEDTFEDSFGSEATAMFYLHPNVSPLLKTDMVVLSGEHKLVFESALKTEIVNCQIATGFNQLVASHAIKVTFRNQVKTRVLIHQ